MKILTPAQYEHNKKICKYCKGTGQDVFNKEKPCPNCSADVEIIYPKQELQEMNSGDIFSADARLKPAVENEARMITICDLLYRWYMPDCN